MLVAPAFCNTCEVELRLQPILSVGTPELRRHVIAAYSGSGTLNEQGRAYISFLTALDLLAFARCAGTVDGALVDAYVGTLLRSHMITLTFITDLSAVLQRCGDLRAPEGLSRDHPEQAPSQCVKTNAPHRPDRAPEPTGTATTAAGPREAATEG